MMSVVQAQETSSQQSARSATTTFRLKRSGIRPKVFDGVEVCSAMTHETGTPFWYELNVYRTVSETFVCEVKFFAKKAGTRDNFKTFDCFNIDELTERLENYDPAQDVDPSIWTLCTEDAPASKVAIEAANLAMLIAEAKRQWADIVGDVLFEIARS